MTVTTRVLTGDDLAAALPDVARLRIDVFRDWPYLYDGDADYERAICAPISRPARWWSRRWTATGSWGRPPAPP